MTRRSKLTVHRTTFWGGGGARSLFVREFNSYSLTGSARAVVLVR